MKTSPFRIAALMTAALVSMTFVSCNEKEELPDGDGRPAVTIEAGAVSSSSISFTMTASNADEVVYMVLSSSGIDLTEDELISNGTSLIYAGDPITRTFNGQPETAYTVYAIALNAGVPGDMASIEMTTGAVPPLEYDDEVSIETARVTYFGVSSVSGVDQYVLSLSDAGNGIDDAGTFMAVPNSMNFRIVLYTPSEADPEHPVFPAGNYGYNAVDRPLAETIDNASACIAYDISGERDYYRSGFLADGSSLAVTRDGDAYSIDGALFVNVAGNVTVLHVTYSGPLPANIGDDDDDIILDRDLLNLAFVSGNAAYESSDGTSTTVSLDLGTSSDGSYAGSGEVLHLEVHAVDIVENQDGTHTLADDTYTVGAESGNRIGAGNFTGSEIPVGSYVATFRSGEVNAADAVTGGTMTIKDGTYTFDLTTQRGHKVTGTYKGSPVISSWPEDSYESTLTGDFEIDFGEIPYAASMANSGDWYDCGNDNWDITIEMADESETVIDHLYLSLITEGTETVAPAEGRYDVCTDVDSPQPMSFMPGMSFSVDYGWASGEYSWWYRESYGSVAGAPFTGGYVDVSHDGDIWTLDLHFTDDAGNNITGTWSGSLAIF